MAIAQFTVEYINLVHKISNSKDKVFSLLVKN